MLSAAAFNALLKTLEEPPAYAIFILATTEKHKVLPTILSRCQVYDFNRITVPDIIAYLKMLSSKEGITASEEALNVVAQKADGGMRDALSIFDQLVAFCGNNITYERTIEVLNVLNTDYYFNLVNCALRHDVAKALLLLNDVLNSGFDAGHFVTGFAQHLRDVLVSKDPQTVQLLETSDAIRKRYAEQAQFCTPMWLFLALDILNTCDINYRMARNKRLTVELALVKLCQLGVPQTVQPAAPPKETPQPKAAAISEAKQSSLSTPPKEAAPTSSEAEQSSLSTPPKEDPQPKAAAIPKMPKIGLGIGLGPKPKAEEPTAAPEQPQEELNRPFTADQLRDAWVGLATTHKEELRLKQLIETYIPHIVEENTAEIQMPNPWQLDQMRNALPTLLAQLRRTLHNKQLTIRLVLAEYDRVQMAYTAEEKYAVMAEQNPVLATLKENLDLQID